MNVSTKFRCILEANEDNVSALRLQSKSILDFFGRSSIEHLRFKNYYIFVLLKLSPIKNKLTANARLNHKKESV